MAELRIVTFNVENWDEMAPGPVGQEQSLRVLIQWHVVGNRYGRRLDRMAGAISTPTSLPISRSGVL
jgi:hypothetical protein